MLAAAGHVVDLAGDGAEAIAAVQAKRYDLVLMDVQMPGMHGIIAAGRHRPGRLAQQYCRRGACEDHL